MRALVRFVVATTKGLQWTLDLIVVLAILCLLALFALQFPHPESIDRFWPVIQLERYGDPILAEAGSLMFAQEEGDPVPWPSEEIRYFPLLLVVGLVAIRLLLRSAFRPILRSGRKYLQSREPGKESPRRGRTPAVKPEREGHDSSREEEDSTGEARAETRPAPEAIGSSDGPRNPETDSEGDAATLETLMAKIDAAIGERVAESGRLSARHADAMHDLEV
ncbi:MAG: hypothetical protein R3234_11225, partial [Thermoanaerobaculia bacterium]|nr:hypothetical protein [Thermoanaerobaculia bacterium]